MVLYYLDSRTKLIDLDDPFFVSVNIEEDMLIIKAYLVNKQGFNPEQASLVQTKKQYLSSEKAND